MIKKIQFYKSLLIEIVETLCTICLYLGIEGVHSHNKMTMHMSNHFKVLKRFSEEMRLSRKAVKNRRTRMRVIDIVYIRKEIQDGILKPYIKKECDGREYVYIKNDIGEVISIGTVDELRANNKSKEEV